MISQNTQVGLATTNPFVSTTAVVVPSLDLSSISTSKISKNGTTNLKPFKLVAPGIPQRRESEPSSEPQLLSSNISSGSTSELERPSPPPLSILVPTLPTQPRVTHSLSSISPFKHSSEVNPGDFEISLSPADEGTPGDSSTACRNPSAALKMNKGTLPFKFQWPSLSYSSHKVHVSSRAPSVLSRVSSVHGADPPHSPMESKRDRAGGEPDLMREHLVQERLVEMGEDYDGRPMHSDASLLSTAPFSLDPGTFGAPLQSRPSSSMQLSPRMAPPPLPPKERFDSSVLSAATITHHAEEAPRNIDEEVGDPVGGWASRELASSLSTLEPLVQRSATLSQVERIRRLPSRGMPARPPPKQPSLHEKEDVGDEQGGYSLAEDDFTRMALRSFTSVFNSTEADVHPIQRSRNARQISRLRTNQSKRSTRQSSQAVAMNSVGFVSKSGSGLQRSQTHDSIGQRNATGADLTASPTGTRPHTSHRRARRKTVESVAKSVATKGDAGTPPETAGPSKSSSVFETLAEDGANWMNRLRSSPQVEWVSERLTSFIDSRQHSMKSAKPKVSLRTLSRPSEATTKSAADQPKTVTRSELKDFL
eukprot:GHVN01035201.1.p1 GENE.GHVN01035201.1~~GHVN01035201.1.p1  ORF type:complete len:593 (-),score=75.57 GHVN01035201.1:2324-4102(-)